MRTILESKTLDGRKIALHITLDQGKTVLVSLDLPNDNAGTLTRAFRLDKTDIHALSAAIKGMDSKR